MVQVLPYVPSFLEKLTPYLNQATSDIGKGLEQRRARTVLEKIFSPTSGTDENGQPTNGPAPIENISPANIGTVYSLLEKSQGRGAAKATLDLILQNRQQSQKESLQDKKFSKQQAAKAEPELLERETKLSHYEQEAARFERLQELFSPEIENKFPSSISVGLFTKDGELRPTAAAALSPEAQEAVKLVADNLSGAKDTFGARVTNFDLQAYMKRLPTLLNSAEGRRRVLRDLRLMNKLNTMHQEGVLEIVDREGGPEKISLSQAERRYRKEHSREIDQLKKEFVNPEKHVFHDRPDAKVYQGRIIVDEQTGERLKSNGKEWVPEE